MSSIQNSFFYGYRVNGRHPYVMNIGGYSREGDWGYVEAFQEMKLQVPVYNPCMSCTCMELAISH